MNLPDLRKITISKTVAMCSLLSFLLLLSAVLNTIKQTSHNAISDCNEFVCSRTRSLSTEQSNDANKTNFWFPIPNWIAGKWQSQSEIILESYDYRQRRQTISDPIRVDATRSRTNAQLRRIVSPTIKQLKEYRCWPIQLLN